MSALHTMAPPEPDPADMAEYLAGLVAQIGVLEAAAADVRRWLAERLPEGTHALRGVRVAVLATRRFDPARAAKVLPPELRERCSVTVVDRAKAQRVLTEEQYRECQTEGKKTVRLT